MHIRKIFFTTGRPHFGDTARMEVASLLDGKQKEMISALMNYDPETGKTITGFPAVHFTGSKVGFGLVGFGELGRTIVEDASPIIHRLLSQKASTPIHIDSKLITASLDWRPYAINYRVPRMIVQTKRGHTEKLKDPEAGSAHLEQLFLTSIRRQAEALGIPVPKGAEVKFLGAQRTFTSKSKKHTQAKLGLVNAEFAVNMNIKGLWSVGYMLSKGFGMFDATYQLASESSGGMD